MDSIQKQVFRQGWIALALLLACSVPAHAAITVDNHKDCGFVTGGTNTCSFVVTAATSLWCGANMPSGDTISGVTYNGVSMTQVGSPLSNGSGVDYLFRLYSPSTGTNNVVASSPNTGDNIDLACVSYNGTATSGQPEASNTATDSSGTVSSLSVSVTTVTAGAWVLTYGDVHSGVGTPTGTGSIANTYSTSGTYEFLGDTGAIASPGSVTTEISNGGNNTKLGLITISIAPAGGAPKPPCAGQLLLLGVGCDRPSFCAIRRSKQRCGPRWRRCASSTPEANGQPVALTNCRRAAR